MAKISQRTSTEYVGLKIRRTSSVQNSENTLAHKLLGLRILVFGTTSGNQYELTCHDCQKREHRSGPLIKFRSESDVVLSLQNSDDRRICISFSFHCYPKHHNNGDSQYRYVIRLEYPSKGHSLSLAWRCCYVNKSNRSLLTFDIASRILLVLLRSGPDTNHHPDTTFAENFPTTLTKKLPTTIALYLRLPVLLFSQLRNSSQLAHLDQVLTTFRAPCRQINQLYLPPVSKIQHPLHHTQSRLVQLVSPCLRPVLKILWMGKILLSKIRTLAGDRLPEV